MKKLECFELLSLLFGGAICLVSHGLAMVINWFLSKWSTLCYTKVVHRILIRVFHEWVVHLPDIECASMCFFSSWGRVCVHHLSLSSGYRQNGNQWWRPLPMARTMVAFSPPLICIHKQTKKKLGQPLPERRSVVNSSTAPTVQDPRFNKVSHFQTIKNPCSNINSD